MASLVYRCQCGNMASKTEALRQGQVLSLLNKVRRYFMPLSGGGTSCKFSKVLFSIMVRS